MVAGAACMVQVYLRDDVVIREGEVSREMYFIKSGAVQASSPSQLLLQANASFCTIEAQKHCQLLSSSSIYSYFRACSGACLGMAARWLSGVVRGCCWVRRWR